MPRGNPQGPCDCGKAAVKRLSSGLVCERCWRLEREWAAEVNRQEAGRHRRDMNRLRELDKWKENLGPQTQNKA